MELKSNEVKQVVDLFVERFQPLMQAFFVNRSANYLALLDGFEKSFVKLQSALNKAKDLPERVELHRAFKTELLQLLENSAVVADENVISDFINTYEDAIQSELSGLSAVVHVKEIAPAYELRLFENPLTSIRKLLFNGGRFITLRIKLLLNVFRRLFKITELEPVVYRKRRVLFRSMSRHYLMQTLNDVAGTMLNQIREAQSRGLIQIWQQDGQMDDDFQQEFLRKKELGELSEQQSLVDLLKQVKVDYLTMLDQFTVSSTESIPTTFHALDEAFAKSDTLDLYYKKFGSKQLLKYKARLHKEFLDDRQAWENTHRALIDDWSVDVEITLLYYSVYDEFNYLQDQMSAYVNKHLLTAFKKIKTYIVKMQQDIKAAGGSKKDLINLMIEERRKVAAQLIDKLLTKTIESLNACFVDDYETLLNDTLELVGKVSDHRSFISNMNYLKGSHSKDLRYISPRDLLHFEALPVFTEKVKKFARYTDAQLEKARVNLLGLGTVCDFSLESAQVMLEQQEGTAKEAAEAAIDGLDRALMHLNKAMTIISDIQEGVAQELSAAVNKFDDDIQKLKKTENIMELNLKIAQIQAMERTRAYKAKLIGMIKELIPLLRKSFRQSRKWMNDQVQALKVRFGLPDERKFVSYELSEFLEMSQQSLQKLPFVYQRLFRLNPTDEDRFFVNRKKELELLHKSLDNWQKDRYITVALIAEKGSGSTSLINYFLKQSNISIPVIRRTLSEKIYIKEQYYDLFSSLFEAEEFHSNEEVIEHIREMEGTRVVILENLQHMFLKQVNGFDVINLFFELMANTMKKVLWVGAYTTHSWNYLDRTTHISNYFTDEIYLEPMSKEMLEKITYKRNRLSGFQIVYKPESADLNLKRYQKMDEHEQQDYLRKKYFSALRQLSSGNISLAQLYWLQSTRLANDEEIHISAANQFDFSFLSLLSNDELFAMQVLVIHDGLCLEHFTQVMGKPISVSRNLLIPMLEKGLLIKPNMKYTINPIIFRPVVNYLVSRNFIN